MISRAKEKEDSDSADGEGIATTKVEAKKKAVFVVEGAPLHYNREVRKMISSNFGRTAHHVNVFEEAVHFAGTG